MVRLFNEEVGEEYIQTREMRDTRLVAEAVTASLHASVASTVSALSTSLRAARRVEVCDEVPCWQELGVRGVQLHRCLQVSSVADLHRSAPASLTRRFEVGAADIKVGVRPFSQGETRAAHHALMDGREAYVAKFIKEEAGAPDGEEGEWLLEEMLALSEASAVAAFLAREFSAQNPAGPRVEFLEAPVAVPAAGRPFNLERAVPAAEFRRFSNNLGWWEPDADEVLMRFAQFTHEATGGYMMVTDLQGVRTAEGGFLLTDPCVLCHDVMRFGGGNMGQRAMERCTASLAALLDAPQEPDIIVDEPAPEPRAHRPAQEQPSGACFPILPIVEGENSP
ncbi:unnamed protein product [Prorocentrum cordatum]|uniref:Alpha-type protein kinase domain-containing protein n=1 Tax=Prorocentrum cordatum TaxID=2364126 RepID=A0ABN9UPR0_9DINO|nr:unnamed protein product [Polarella glacialis]